MTPVPIFAASVIADFAIERYPVGLASPIIASAPSRGPSVDSTRPAKVDSGVPTPESDGGPEPIVSHSSVSSTCTVTGPKLLTLDTACIANGPTLTVATPVVVTLLLLAGASHSVTVVWARVADVRSGMVLRDRGKRARMTGSQTVAVGAIPGVSASEYSTRKLPALVVSVTAD